MNLVIAYDDDPTRYHTLAKLLAPHGIILVTVEHPEALKPLLWPDYRPPGIKVVALLLDHDLRPLPTQDAPRGPRMETLMVSRKGKPWSRKEFVLYTGQDVLKDVARRLPVADWPPCILTSINIRGRAAMASRLRSAGRTFEGIPCDMPGAEAAWLDTILRWSAPPRSASFAASSMQRLVGDGCPCRACRSSELKGFIFIVCPDCGNKRCPKANHHDSDCTNSNEPGQAGSAYP